ncbi:MAG: YlxR family protein [bacterium]|nr:YlxR family protein [bacterium]
MTRRPDIAGPVRSCAGCGARAPQQALVRFVAVAGALVLDPRRRRPGRGAYLHRDASCAQSFIARRGPVRSLRCNPARAAREALVGALTAPTEAEA